MVELHFSSFNHQKLINEIEKRPCLWNLAEKPFCDRFLKQREWQEVAKSYFKKEWIHLNNEEKQEKVDFLVKKWKSIRDYYIREKRKINEDGSSSATAKNKKKNSYFELLHFLDNITKQSTNSFSSTASPESTQDSYANSSIEIIDNDDENGHTEFKTLQFTDQPILEFKQSASEQAYNSPVTRFSHPKKRIKMTQFQECLLKKIDDKNENDPNRHFLLSLVPEMSKMTDTQNFQFRMGVMRVLNEVKYQLPENPPHCTSFLCPVSDSSSCIPSIVDRKFPSNSSDSENE